MQPAMAGPAERNKILWSVVCWITVDMMNIKLKSLSDIILSADNTLSWPNRVADLTVRESVCYWLIEQCLIVLLVFSDLVIVLNTVYAPVEPIAFRTPS